MSTIRIIKKILKKSINQSSFYSEINILKSLKHPSIPIIYDVFEDDMACYIVEEFIEGESLSNYLQAKGVLSEKEAITIGIKICEIISFLHSQKPIPILFLDVHLGNFIIRGDRIFIIDFGNSFYLQEVCKRELALGTVGFAAPEQYGFGKLDERADIYGIGAVLYSMVSGKKPDPAGAKSLEFPDYITNKFRAIVHQCLLQEMDKRFKSVNMLIRNLEELINNDNVYSDIERPRIISVLGTQPHIGATYVSLALAAYLSRQAYNVVYEECNDSNHIRLLAKNSSLRYSGGFFYQNGLKLMPRYGPQIKLEMECNYIVRDYGYMDSIKLKDKDVKVGESDLIIIVAGVREWEIDNSLYRCQKLLDELKGDDAYGKVCIIANLASNNRQQILWKHLGYVGHSIGYFEDTFNLDDNTENIFSELINNHTNGRNGGDSHKKKARLLKRIKGKGKQGFHWHNRHS